MAVAAGVVSPDLAVSATIGAVGALLPYPADVISRALSKNESRRIKSVEGIAIQEINSRITAGFQPRADGFFDKEINGRSPAGEIFEGVLQIARSEYEEEKLPYLGYLFASIAFDCSVSRGEGNRLIQQLESLSYRKICILTALSQKLDRDSPWRSKCFNLDTGSDELAGLMQDCFELQTLALIQENCDQSPHFGMHSWAYVVPAELKFTVHGSKLINFAQLFKVPRNDWEKIDHAMSA